MTSRELALPNVLLLGGMKCGSTTLYGDLASHPDIDAPQLKEPGYLWYGRGQEKRTSRLYSGHYSDDSKCPIRVDGSTRYGLRSQSPQVWEFARNILGSEIRLIYIVRDPVSRFMSHYRHASASGFRADTVEQAIALKPELKEASMYWAQLEPWFEKFNPNQILVISFEEYIQQRHYHLNKIATFLNIEEFEKSESYPELNKASQRVVARWPFNYLQAAPFYKRFLAGPIRNILPNTCAKLFTHKSPGRVPDVSPSELELLRDCFKQDYEKLQRVLQK